MSFKLSCEKCGNETELKGNFLKYDSDFNVQIIGDDLIQIKCNKCKNDIISFND